MTDHRQATAGEGDDEGEYSSIVDAFSRKSSVGVYQFLFDFWPAWMVDGQRKSISPLCRIILGDDDDGSIVLDKNVLLTGILHLIEDLTRAVAVNTKRAAELPGFSMSVPGGESHVRGIIDRIESILKDVRAMVDNDHIFVGFDDEEDESSAETPSS
jgi:hypothetical protein